MVARAACATAAGTIEEGSGPPKMPRASSYAGRVEVLGPVTAAAARGFAGYGALCRRAG